LSGIAGPLAFSRPDVRRRGPHARAVLRQIIQEIKSTGDSRGTDDARIIADDELNIAWRSSCDATRRLRDPTFRRRAAVAAKEFGLT
jgi:hypothetical protein